MNEIVGDTTGSIERGKSADMIVTAKNSLDDLRALRHVETVIMRGKNIKNPSFRRRKNVESELDKFL